MVVGYGEKNIINNLSFSIKPASFYSIIGLNGSGKSSLLKAIIGELSYTGVVESSLVGGEIGYLPQHSNMDLPIKVKDLVVMGRYRFKGSLENYNGQDYLEVDKLLTELGLIDLRDRDFQSLSGGEKQMVLFCQKILQQPKILILDEPMKNLDLRNQRRLTIYLIDFVKEGNTVIWVTHDLKGIPNALQDSYMLNMSRNPYELKLVNELLIEQEYDFLSDLN